MDVTTADNTTAKGEDWQGKEGILQIRHLLKSPSHKTPSVCKSTLLLVSFLCHVTEMVYNTEKSNILHPFLTHKLHSERATLPGMPPQPQDNSDSISQSGLTPLPDI